ncbi:MAG: hypothetical protein V1744_03220 [Candidatus Altiarchaeota archaeon]
MEDVWDVLMDEKKTIKSLLNLVIREEGISPTDSAEILGVERSIMDKWVTVLLGKRYVEVDAKGLLKPTKEFWEKYRKVRENSEAIGVEGDITPQDDLRSELEGEQQKIKKLEAELEEKTRILDSIKADLIAEKKSKAELEERLEEVRRQGKREVQEKVGEVHVRLDRECAERGKLEELLRRIRAGGEIPEGEVEGVYVEESKPEGKVEELTQVNEVKPERAEPKPVERVVGSVEGEGDVRLLLRMLEEKSPVSLKDAAKKLGADPGLVGAWVKELDRMGAVDIKRSIFGGVNIRLRKDIELSKVMQEVEGEKVRDELARMRGRR